MISVCIPVYNYNVVELVQDLSRQLDTIQGGGEILVFDDASDPSFQLQNGVLKNSAHVHYRVLSQNSGRTRIRSLLAQAATFRWLLFIDSDSKIINEQFLYNYCRAIKEDGHVFTGGRVYSKEPPEACTKKLHWTYGTKRESEKGGTTALHTNNFLIRTELFRELNFPPYLKAYGHEDTWMQMELLRKGISIKHISNPLLHEGLEEANIFLKKADQAAGNLLLIARHDDKALLMKQSELYKTFHILSRFHLADIFSSLFRTVEKRVAANLSSCKPSLFYLDMWKLYRLAERSKQRPE